MKIKGVKVILLAGLLAAAAVADAQILQNDPYFAFLHQLRWDMSMDDVRAFADREGILLRSTDSSIVLRSAFFGFDAQTSVQFGKAPRKLTMVNIQFTHPSEAAADSVINHFTAFFGRAPGKVVKEKSFLIFTVRAEMFYWSGTEDLVNIVRFARGESVLGVNFSLLDPKSIKSKK